MTATVLPDDSLSADLPAVEYRSIDALRPYAGNARIHSAKQVRQITASIRAFGFVNPVLVGPDGNIIAGHGRVAAAR
ncbi:MAG: ParB/Srx family N-terminal domain-containing protein [Pseudomonadota bacterium]